MVSTYLISEFQFVCVDICDEYKSKDAHIYYKVLFPFRLYSCYLYGYTDIVLW